MLLPFLCAVVEHSSLLKITCFFSENTFGAEVVSLRSLESCNLLSLLGEMRF